MKARYRGYFYSRYRFILFVLLSIHYCMIPALAVSGTNEYKQEDSLDESLNIVPIVKGFSPSVEWRQEWEGRSTRITREKIKLMSSEEFLKFLKTHTVVYVGDSTLYGVETRIESWPDAKDIPYLLSQIDNIAPCASLDSGTFAIGPAPSYSTVGQQAVILLYAIKQGVFDVNKSPDIADSEVIEWAREQAGK